MSRTLNREQQLDNSRRTKRHAPQPQATLIEETPVVSVIAQPAVKIPVAIAEEPAAVLRGVLKPKRRGRWLLLGLTLALVWRASLPHRASKQVTPVIQPANLHAHSLEKQEVAPKGALLPFKDVPLLQAPVDAREWQPHSTFPFLLAETGFVALPDACCSSPFILAVSASSLLRHTSEELQAAPAPELAIPESLQEVAQALQLMESSVRGVARMMVLEKQANSP